MSATKPRIPFTYADYKSLPESLDRYELLDGELVMVPAPTTTHQSIQQNLLVLLVQHVRATGCGRVLHAPVDVVLGEGRQREVVQPDIVFVSKERLGIITVPEIRGAPDLVVEVLSPGTVNRDRGYKKALYARSGVREYWIVDPKLKSIDVLRLGATGYAAPARYRQRDAVISGVLPDLRVTAAEAFRT